MISRWPGFEWGSATWMWLLYLVSMKLLPVLPLVYWFASSSSAIATFWEPDWDVVERCWKVTKLSACETDIPCIFPMIGWWCSILQGRNLKARNLKHEKAETVRNAFEKIYNMPESSVVSFPADGIDGMDTWPRSHDIQRDQFLLPYYLWLLGPGCIMQCMICFEIELFS